MDVRDEIGRSRVVAVLRARDTRFFAPVSDALVSHGIRAIEFTLTTPGALDALEQYRSSGSEACLGMGTVLSASDAKAAVSCGAEFLVTPVLLPEVVEAGAALGVPVICGAMTPGEIWAAHSAGAALVKIFPGGTLGADYVRLVRDPFPELSVVPSGGIKVGEVAEYLMAGATAVALGSQLVGGALRYGDLAALRKRLGTWQLDAGIDA
jgi:2-dehydro-3-deoxyphosphogluconate aldolase / (4S)-4-hydroxy-2-oxoglutarate aldolase